MPYLKTDIYSFCHRTKLYAKAGDEVRIVRQADNVLIVEALTGLRFSITDDQLVTDPKDKEESIPVVKAAIPSKKVSRKSAPPAAGQNSLF
jgi:hypothetical protein